MFQQKHSYTFKALPLEHIPVLNTLDTSTNTEFRIDGSLVDTVSKETVVNTTTELKFI